MGGFPLAPPSFRSGQLSKVSLLSQEPYWSPAGVQLPVVPVQFQEWIPKDFLTIIPTFTSLSGSQMFPLPCQIIQKEP